MPPSAVVFVTAHPGAPGRYRCVHAAEQLGLQGVPSAVFHAAQTAEAGRALADGGVLVLHRMPLGPVVEELIRASEARGAVPVFDCDDDLFRAPPDLRGTRTARLRRALYADEIRRYRAAARRCRALLVSTERLKRSAARLGRPCFVHPNAFSRRLRELSAPFAARPAREKVVLGYASGSPTHDRNFLQAKPALVRILNEHPRVAFRVVGPVDIGDGWGAAANRILRQPSVAWEQLPAVLAAFDINLAPLDVADPFVAAKSEVKFIEAALVGVPTVASPSESFVGAMHPGRTGLLAGTQEEWEGALAQLVTDVAARGRMGEAARQDVLERWSPEARAPRLMRTLGEILALAGRPALIGASAPAPGFPSEVPRAGWAARGWFTARNRGWGILLRQALARRGE